MEASPERVRDHLRRSLPVRRNVLIKTAGNTLNEIGPRARPSRQPPSITSRNSDVGAHVSSRSHRWWLAPDVAVVTVERVLSA